jgi:hypothetical protein
VSTPMEPQPSTGPAGGRPPSTEEIPVFTPTGATATGKALPPHPDAALPAPVPMAAAQPTGPVDFMPGLPGAGAPPVPPPASSPAPPVQPQRAPQPPPPPPPPPAPAPMAATAVQGPVWPDTLDADGHAQERPRKPRASLGPGDRSALVGIGLTALAVALLLIGLTLDVGGDSFWSVVPLWSGFAVLCALLGLLAFAACYLSGKRLRSGPAWQVAAAGMVGLSVFWLLVVLPRVDTDRGFVLTAALACLGGALWIGPRTRA